MASTAARAAAHSLPSVRPTARRAIPVPAPDAGKIAEALIVEMLRLVDRSVRHVSRELVVPVTSERADVAAIGDETWLFEIKSDRDSLRRLPRQAEAFARIADRCVLVAASRHINNAGAALPPWWGLIEVPDGPVVTLRWRRAAESNPDTDRRTLLLMLRRDEAEAALTSLDGRRRTGWRRMALLAALDRRLDDEGVALCVRDALVHRPHQAEPLAADLLEA